MLVTFSHADLKFSLFNGRDNLRTKGIRVANDLTSQEKEKLNDLKQKGKVGYFHKGKLHVRLPKANSNNRVFLNARRRTEGAMAPQSTFVSQNNTADPENENPIDVD